MPDKVISKNDLRQWLVSLMADHDVIAPVDRGAGPAAWKDIDGKEEIEIGTNGLLMAAKEYLLPVHDVLFRYKGKKGEQILEAPEMSTKPKLMIGLRLCDARAISVLDSVYLEGRFRDPYYAARRENLTLMATVCDDPRWSCFCTSVGDLNEWAKTVDALITDLGDKVYVAPVTEKSAKLLSSPAFKEPTEEDVKKKTQVWENLLALPKQPFAGKDISQSVSWDDPIWKDMADRCLGCGACSYQCPSCTCFDIQDDTVGNTIERYRCRDTCQFSDFTRMGAGHNPRPEKTMRTRQRVMHKFKYQMEQFNMIGCTGCGRCVESCPVNIDLREVLSKITEQKL
ncbi:MAG: 4Fe-4S dicluster domain-containing protein [Armatimonadota bacterium]